MNSTEKILHLITGRKKDEEDFSVLSEMESDEALQAEYNTLKNAWALLSSEKEMPEKEVNDLFARFKLQLPETKKRSVKILFYQYSKYAAILVLGMILSYAGLKLLPVSGVFSSNEMVTTVIADNNQISKIILPDSTVVWINSGSKITYNSKFAVNNRNIELNGQAYFHAAKNKNLPLIVSAGKLNVKVLGTKFDVCAYPGEENIRVILESGKVQLSYKDDQFLHYELLPGDMVTYCPADNKFLKRKVEPQWYSSWKEGTLIFREEPMASVIAELKRRYNVDIEVSDSRIYQSVFNAKIKDEPLDKVLKSMEFSCSVKATIVRNPDTPNSKLKVILSKSE